MPSAQVGDLDGDVGKPRLDRGLHVFVDPFSDEGGASRLSLDQKITTHPVSQRPAPATLHDTEPGPMRQLGPKLPLDFVRVSGGDHQYCLIQARPETYPA